MKAKFQTKSDEHRKNLGTHKMGYEKNNAQILMCY